MSLGSELSSTTLLEVRDFFEPPLSSPTSWLAGSSAPLPPPLAPPLSSATLWLAGSSAPFPPPLAPPLSSATLWLAGSSAPLPPGT
ncbi:MAG: hypothetical protein FIA97_07010 [Methylococcaceae bacterium]|nr:hypothetical protein [Methylococcaceae bacterium]